MRSTGYAVLHPATTRGGATLKTSGRLTLGEDIFFRGNWGSFSRDILQQLLKAGSFSGDFPLDGLLPCVKALFSCNEVVTIDIDIKVYIMVVTEELFPIIYCSSLDVFICISLMRTVSCTENRLAYVNGRPIVRTQCRRFPAFIYISWIFGFRINTQQRNFVIQNSEIPTIQTEFPTFCSSRNFGILNYIFPYF